MFSWVAAGFAKTVLHKKSPKKRLDDHIHSRSLTARPWKIMVGRRSFPSGARVYFQGRPVFSKALKLAKRPPPLELASRFFDSNALSERWHSAASPSESEARRVTELRIIESFWGSCIVYLYMQYIYIYVIVYLYMIQVVYDRMHKLRKASCSGHGSRKQLHGLLNISQGQAMEEELQALEVPFPKWMHLGSW